VWFLGMSFGKKGGKLLKKGKTPPPPPNPKEQNWGP